jgi:nucleoid DNA-binding protein
MTTSTQHRMTKHQLAQQVAANTGIADGQAVRVVDAAFGVIGP